MAHESSTTTAPPIDPLVASVLHIAPPRPDDAVRLIVRAQRSRWRTTYTYVAITSVASVAATIANPAWWLGGIGIALLVSWLLCVALIWSRHRSAVLLARRGRLSSGTVEPSPRGPEYGHVLRFADVDGNERLAQWVPNGRRRGVEPGSTVSVLYLVDGRLAFAWAPGLGGSAYQTAVLIGGGTARDSSRVDNSGEEQKAADATSDTELPGALTVELATALRSPGPRAGAAFRALVRAQRKDWQGAGVVAILTVGFCGIYALADRGGFVDSQAFWIAVLALVLTTGFALLGSFVARRLARHGEVAVARLEPLGRGYYAVYFGDNTNGERRSVWNAGYEITAGTSATVLFEPRGRWSYVWASGVSGVARQDALPEQPRAHLRR